MFQSFGPVKQVQTWTRRDRGRAVIVTFESKDDAIASVETGN